MSTSVSGSPTGHKQHQFVATPSLLLFATTVIKLWWLFVKNFQNKNLACKCGGFMLTSNNSSKDLQNERQKRLPTCEEPCPLVEWVKQVM
jgi:hypothetical protein